MRSPFEELQIEARLVCEFFAAFARFEYAMKATAYCREDRYANALPDWPRLKAEIGPAISEMRDEATIGAVSYLLAEPPLVQKYVEGRPVFCEYELDGIDAGAKAIEAAKRTRNNLFHGGKHTRHSMPERDTRLIESSLVVLDACLLIDDALRHEFEHQVF